MLNFAQVNPALPGPQRWRIARHEYSPYDAELFHARPEQRPAIQAKYAEEAMKHAVKTKDRELAKAVINWAQQKGIA